MESDHFDEDKQITLFFFVTVEPQGGVSPHKSSIWVPLPPPPSEHRSLLLLSLLGRLQIARAPLASYAVVFVGRSVIRLP